jgi:hypothetical protein
MKGGKARDLGTKRKQSKGRKPMLHVPPGAMPRNPMLRGTKPRGVKP